MVVSSGSLQSTDFPFELIIIVIDRHILYSPYTVDFIVRFLLF